MDAHIFGSRRGAVYNTVSQLLATREAVGTPGRPLVGRAATDGSRRNAPCAAVKPLIVCSCQQWAALMAAGGDARQLLAEGGGERGGSRSRLAGGSDMIMTLCYFLFVNVKQYCDHACPVYVAVLPYHVFAVRTLLVSLYRLVTTAANLMPFRVCTSAETVGSHLRISFLCPLFWRAASRD